MNGRQVAFAARCAAATPPRLPTAIVRAAKSALGQRADHDVERDVNGCP